MKVNVQAQYLQPGDVVGSGETVISAQLYSYRIPYKIAVTLEKNGNRRTAYWGKYTTINAEREVDAG